MKSRFNGGVLVCAVLALSAWLLLSGEGKPNFVVVLVDDLRWDELYDLRSDTYEMVNLIADPPAQPVLEGLKAELAGLEK